MDNSAKGGKGCVPIIETYAVPPVMNVGLEEVGAFMLRINIGRDK